MTGWPTSPNIPGEIDYDVLIVGAGFGGLYALHHLRDECGLRCRVLESGGGVGGTWYWNRYPGVCVDIESLEYSYSFSDELQQEWTWSKRYPEGAEMLRYLNHVTDRFGLRSDIQLNAEVTSAVFDEEAGVWELATATGEILRSRYCVMAVGLLSSKWLPDIPGLDSFDGEIYHTGGWPDAPVNFTDRRVGVIGTGASGVQVIPVVAEQADELFVFQRSPHWCVPKHDQPINPEYERYVKENYAELRRVEHEAFGGYTLVDFKIATPPPMSSYPHGWRALDHSPEERLREYEYRWNSGGLCFYTSYTDLLFDEEANKTLREFFEKKIRGIVKDQDVATALIPTDHPIMTKRLCGVEGYYETYNRDNVHLVDVKTHAIAQCDPTGLGLDNGEHYPLDILICATGWDAATGPLLRINITGRNKRSLADHWAGGTKTHLGLMSHGFPNLFILDGPQSPGAFFQPVLLVEHQSRWIGRLIKHLTDSAGSAIEPTLAAETDWAHHVNTVANATLMPRANSWYMGANVPGKTRESLYYLGGFPEYHRRCELAHDGDYQEFVITDAHQKSHA